MIFIPTIIYPDGSVPFQKYPEISLYFQKCTENANNNMPDKFKTSFKAHFLPINIIHNLIRLA